MDMHGTAAMRRALFLLMLAAAGGCTKTEDASVSSKPPPAPPVKVSLVTAAATDTPDLLTLTGTVTPNWRSEVTADTQGKVINVLVERGQRVKLGQPCVSLDVRSAALSAREAQANLSAAKAQRELADTECARTKSLLDKGAITKEEYDRQENQCTTALSSVAAAEARVQLMSKSVGDGVIYAPYNGIVTERDVSPGEWVNPGKALFTLVDDDPLRIDLSVPEAAVAQLSLNQRVDVVAVAYPDKTFHASITRIGAEIGKSRALTVEATFDKGTDLLPGMFAEARVQIGTTKRPVLPADAVVRRGKAWHAFVADKGELSDRIVQLGPSMDKDHVSILQGVAANEKVVAKVTDQVVDGAKVAE
jgi:membrane fusion protein (multidrug efflux system)